MGCGGVEVSVKPLLSSLTLPVCDLVCSEAHLRQRGSGGEV